MKILRYGGNKQFSDFCYIYGIEQEPMETRYFTKACQLYRDKLKQMAERDENFIFHKRELLKILPLDEGK